jgi:hypothetical protein
VGRDAYFRGGACAIPPPPLPPLEARSPSGLRGVPADKLAAQEPGSCVPTKSLKHRASCVLMIGRKIDCGSAGFGSFGGPCTAARHRVRPAGD